MSELSLRTLTRHGVQVVRICASTNQSHIVFLIAHPPLLEVVFPTELAAFGSFCLCRGIVMDRKMLFSGPVLLSPCLLVSPVGIPPRPAPRLAELFPSAAFSRLCSFSCFANNMSARSKVRVLLWPELAESWKHQHRLDCRIHHEFDCRTSIPMLHSC